MSVFLISDWSHLGCYDFRGEGPAQRSDPDHPSQLRSDQHGGAQHYSGLPAQHSQVNLTTTECLTLSFTDPASATVM